MKAVTKERWKMAFVESGSSLNDEVNADFLIWPEGMNSLQAMMSGKIVACVYSKVPGKQDLRTEKRALAMAAAPELLNALKGVLPLAQNWADGKGSSHPDHEWIAEALAAIAKADGQS